MSNHDSRNPRVYSGSIKYARLKFIALALLCLGVWWVVIMGFIKIWRLAQ